MSKSSYTSDELFHLVGRSQPDDHEANFETLRKILKAGCISYSPHFPLPGRNITLTYNEDRSIMTEDLVVVGVTCFCDIPLSHLDIHIKKYGQFGLSFDRHHLTRYGARPVIYVPLRHDDFWSINGATFIKHVQEVYKGFKEHVVDPIQVETRSSTLGARPASAEDAIMELDSILSQHFIAYIKAYNSELEDDDPNNFYMEREWRKIGPFQFQPAQVKRVLIRRGYVKRFINEFPDYSEKIEVAPSS
jgi:hypothetical protein